MWLRFVPDDGGDATEMHLDPGPGALVRATSAVPPCDPVKLDALLLSHKHLDHAGDINVMIEAMTTGGPRLRRRGGAARGVGAPPATPSRATPSSFPTPRNSCRRTTICKSAADPIT